VVAAAPKGGSQARQRRLDLSLPRGKTQGKIFSGLRPRRKIKLYHRLGLDAQQESKSWQGTGREARKPSDGSQDRTDH
jgi:hypothetical protein